MSVETLTTLVDVCFHVNGDEVRASVPPGMTLLRFLRDRLHLVGSKDGCSTGHCGACTVIVDGRAQRACLVKMSRVNGGRVETIEGLAKNGVLHPLQQAFIEKGAVQCGFCIPGMLMSAKALLDANPRPSLEEIKKHLAQGRNLCRCTGYIKIFEAIQLAAERMAGLAPAPEPPPLGDPTFGRPMTDAAAVEAVTGATVYGDDIDASNMIYGKIRWADYPHARILNVDTSEAEAMPGVVAVITPADIPGKNQCGLIIRDQPAIAADKTRYIGDGLAAVFAESSEIADEAVKKIKIDYEVLPGVFSPQQAALPDAPRVHEKGNLLHHVEIVRGDVDEAFDRCAVIVEDDYQTPFIEHGFLEPESGVCEVQEDGTLLMKIGTQCAFDDRTQLSEILAVPEEKIRVIQNPMGGAFGAKEDLILQQYLALAALKTHRKVKMVLTREESLRVHQKRHPAWIHYKTGADKQGNILALECDILLDTGAYCALGMDILENTVVFGAGPYYVPNLKITGKAYYTNNVMAGAMRGFGVNQMAFALEQQLDAMGRALGIDPFSLRLKNALDVGLPSAADHIMEEGIVSIKQTITAARDAFARMQLPVSNGKRIGVGVASAVKNIGYGHNIPEDAGAIVQLDQDGNLTVLASQAEYGQGARVGLIKLAALELGIPLGKVSTILPDTALTPPTGPTTASRQTFISGNALVMACRTLKEQLFAHAAEVIGEPPARLKLEGDRIVDSETGKSLPLKSLGERFTVSKKYVPPPTDQMHPVGKASRFGKADFRSMVTHYCYAYNTQVAIVEADPATGEVKVLKVISANDVGKILNRQAIEGQIHGGVVMGLGFALSEQYLVKDGYNLTDTLYKVRMPYADAIPEIEPIIVEVPHPFGPLGAKGFAEAPSLATAPAIINAIYDALGVRITELPADRKRVLEAVQSHKELKFVRKP